MSDRASSICFFGSWDNAADSTFRMPIFLRRIFASASRSRRFSEATKILTFLAAGVGSTGGINSRVIGRSASHDSLLIKDR